MALRKAAPMKEEKNMELQCKKKSCKMSVPAKPSQPVRPSLDLAQKIQTTHKQSQIASDLARRGNVQQTFKQLEKTQEWAEAQYYQSQPRSLDKPGNVQSERDRLRVSAFWVAVAEQVELNPEFFELSGSSVHGQQQQQQQRENMFLSPTFVTQGRGSFSDQIFALSLLDLPFEGAQLSIQFAPSRVTISSSKPMIAFYRDLGDSPLIGSSSSSSSSNNNNKNKNNNDDVVVEQHYFNPNFRQQQNYDTGESKDFWIVEEFQFNKIYGCQVRVITSKSMKVDVMTQIPVGAVPVGHSGFYTKSHMLSCSSSYSGSSSGSSNSGNLYSVTVEYLFYFPAIGKYQHYPAHVAVENNLVAFAEPTILNVVQIPTAPPPVPQAPVDKSTWAYISQCGSDEEVFKYLDLNGPHSVKLELIQFRCQNSIDFWRNLIKLLQKRHLVNMQSSSWCFAYYDPEGIAEFLSHPQLSYSRNSNFFNYIQAPFHSNLLRLDEDEMFLYQHLEYAPLVNARAHTLGQSRKILNSKFSGQYSKFLEVLCRKPQIVATDLMAACYYLLLQDRINEAHHMFERISLLPISFSSFSSSSSSSSKNNNSSSSSLILPQFDKSGNPIIIPGASSKRDFTSLLEKSPTDSPFGPTAPVDSPRFFNTQMQYDYMAAYLDFLDERHQVSGCVPPVAQNMCSKYHSYPVSRWSSRFKDMEEQLKEIAAFSQQRDISIGGGDKETKASEEISKEISKEDNKPDPERMRVLLERMWNKTRASFDMSINGKRLSIDYCNISKVQLRFYIMDLELLFSTKPFFLTEHSGGGGGDNNGNGNGGPSSSSSSSASSSSASKKGGGGGGGNNSMFIKPNVSIEEKLPEPEITLLSAAATSGTSAPIQTHLVDIPEKLQDQNLIVEAIVPGGIRKTLTYFANSLLLSVQPQVGQLQVLERIPNSQKQRPIPGAYVKVYAKIGDADGANETPFWKDLYTDLRGRADYCSLSDAAADLSSVTAFSILVVTGKNGSVIREVAPPGL